MLITDPSATARDAAEQYARNYSESGRKVGNVRVIERSSATPGGGIDFQLANGVRWYSVRMRHDYAGWLITPID